MKSLIIIGAVFLLISCKTTPENAVENRIKIPATAWRFALDLNGDILPFNGTFSEVKDYTAKLTLTNAEEEIIIEEVRLQNDSVIIPLPFFNTEMRLRIDSPYMLSGVWINLDKDDYQIPITAEQGQNFRFTNTGSSKKIPLKYMVKFEIGTPTEFPAVLELDNSSGKLTGTFLTETGDYRFLEGNIMNDAVYLSTFDGSHAFYFRADIEGDSLVNGVFKSGIHYQTNWMAFADSTAALRNPTEITTVHDAEPIDFSLLNQDGATVHWEDLDLDGKVVVLDIMGTWCPNCMDASRALKKLSAPYSEDDLVVVPVLFEYADDFAQAKIAFAEYAKQLNLREEFLFGGRASKKIAGEKFPMLSSISSFPTLIFVGRDRQVAEIYSGFYGPGTGLYYTQFIRDKTELLEDLVARE